MVEITLPDSIGVVTPDLVFTLPNGIKVECIEPDGNLLQKALKMLPEGAPSADTTYALISQSATFNGKKLRMEEIRSMKLRQLTVLMREFGKLMGTSDAGAAPLAEVVKPEVEPDNPSPSSA